MSDMQKKQNFLQGTALLAMATAIVKVIGALYKIPLNAIIGEQGFGYFNTAYDIYNVLLMISSTTSSSVLNQPKLNRTAPWRSVPKARCIRGAQWAPGRVAMP